MAVVELETSLLGGVAQVGEASHGIQVYRGEALNELSRVDLERLADETHVGLKAHEGFMRQMTEDEVLGAIDASRFVVSALHRPDGGVLFLATAHAWPIGVDAPGEHEVGTLLKLNKDNPAAKGQPEAVIFAGAQLAKARGAVKAYSMAAEENTQATSFFDSLEGVEDVGNQPSTFVLDANGIGVPMRRYNVTRATGRRKLPRGRGV